MRRISAYRRYPQPDWYYRQSRPVSRPQQPRSREQKPPERPDPPPPRKEEHPRGARPEKPGLAGMLSSILPEGLDAGDIFLAAMLLFLYSESGDEDFLIILIVVGLSIFKKDKDN